LTTNYYTPDGAVHRGKGRRKAIAAGRAIAAQGSPRGLGDAREADTGNGMSVKREEGGVLDGGKTEDATWAAASRPRHPDGGIAGRLPWARAYESMRGS
jgi:hypothetical protein